jgi:hypothetical protein
MFRFGVMGLISIGGIDAQPTIIRTMVKSKR